MMWLVLLGSAAMHMAVAEHAQLQEGHGTMQQQQQQPTSSGQAASSGQAMSSEHVLQQLEDAGSDVKKIAAVIQGAKEAGLPEEEMEIARRAAQRAILGDYSKNTVRRERAIKQLKQTLTDRQATAADKRRALGEAERSGVNSENHYLFAEYVRQVEDAEMWAKKSLQEELDAKLTFVDRLRDTVDKVGQRELLLACVMPGLFALCLAVWRACNKPSAASLEQELLAEEAKELARKSKRGDLKAAAIAARRREAQKAQFSKPRLENTTSEQWAPRYDEADKQPEYATPPVGELLDEGSFQVVQKPQKKLAQRKRSSGSADAIGSGAKRGVKGTKAASKATPGGKQHSTKAVSSVKASATDSTTGVAHPKQASKMLDDRDKSHSSPATTNGGSKRSSEPRQKRDATRSKGGKGKDAPMPKRGARAEQGGKRRSTKQQARDDVAAPAPVVVKNAWFKNVSAPAPAPVPKPEPTAKPTSKPAPEPLRDSNHAGAPSATAKSKAAGWLPTVWSVGSAEAHTDSDEDSGKAFPSGRGASSSMPSPVPRLAFAGLPPPRIQQGGQAEDSPASAAAIRFGDSPGSSATAAGIRFGAFPSPMGSQKQTTLEKDADSDDDWRASSQPQTSPASAAAAAAAKMFGGWGDPSSSSGGSGSATRNSRRSPTAGDGSSFSGRSKPAAARTSSPTGSASADSATAARPPLPSGGRRSPALGNQRGKSPQANKGAEPDWQTLRSSTHNAATSKHDNDSEGEWTKVEGPGSARASGSARSRDTGSARSNGGRSSPAVSDDFDFDKLGGSRGWADYTPPSSAAADKNKNPWGD